MWYETPPEELPEEDPPEEPAPHTDPPQPLPVAQEVPDQLARDGRIPFDHARGAEYQSGEVPPGWNTPLP